jgi:hypothetical protein
MWILESREKSLEMKSATRFGYENSSSSMM